jgi:hypothetical protein
MSQSQSSGARTILILEDSDDRIFAFEKAVAALGSDYSLKLWHDAPTMIEECAGYFGRSVLISLDYQLMRRSGAVVEPGNGFQVAQYLCNQQPVCPVIIHTSADERRWSMFNALSFAKWDAHVVVPNGRFWIRDSWSTLVKRLLAKNGDV